jgi:ribosomal protein L7/L12
MTFDHLCLFAGVAALAYGAYVIGKDHGARGRADPQRTSLSAAEAFSKLGADLQSEVDGLLRDKKIIEAIKRVRSAAGLGLKESKDIVDARRTVLN